MRKIHFLKIPTKESHPHEKQIKIFYLLIDSPIMGYYLNNYFILLCKNEN